VPGSAKPGAMRIRVAARRDAAFEQRKRNLEAAAYLARNWKFESISLQRGVKCEPEDDIVVGGRSRGKIATPFDVPKRPSSTVERATYLPYSCCWGIPRSRAPSGTSAWRSMTLSPWPNKWTSELRAKPTGFAPS